MVSRRVILGIFIAAVLVLSAVYYVSAVSGGSKNSVTVVIQVTNGTAQNGAADAFSPRNFTVVEGQQVTLVFENNDDNTHELVIPLLASTPTSFRAVPARGYGRPRET